jgi:mRNA degradation ribonuclease J1/J2
MDESRKFVTKTLNKLMAKNKEQSAIKKKCERELADFLYKKTGKNTVSNCTHCSDIIYLLLRPNYRIMLI